MILKHRISPLLDSSPLLVNGARGGGGSTDRRPDSGTPGEWGVQGFTLQLLKRNLCTLYQNPPCKARDTYLPFPLLQELSACSSCASGRSRGRSAGESAGAEKVPARSRRGGVNPAARWQTPGAAGQGAAYHEQRANSSSTHTASSSQAAACHITSTLISSFKLSHP